MINRPTSMPAFSQVALGVVIGCLPILALILLDGCRPGWLIYGLYLTLNLALYLYLRYLPWVGFGIFLSLINLVPLLFASFKGGEYFGAISFAGVIKYYLPLCTVGFFLAEGSGVLAEPLTEPLNSKKLSGLATSVMVELGSLVTPWCAWGL